MRFRAFTQEGDADEQGNEGEAGTDGGGNAGGGKLRVDAVDEQAGGFQQADDDGEQDTERERSIWTTRSTDPLPRMLRSRSA